MERREFVEAGGVLGTVASASETFVNSTDSAEILQYRGREPVIVHAVPGDNHYRLMVEHFADVALGNATLRYGMEHSTSNLKAIEALYQSARSGGRPVSVRAEVP